MSIDPVTTDANTGGSFNRYAYANNSPYKYTDPDGRQARGIRINCQGGCVTTVGSDLSDIASSLKEGFNSSVAIPAAGAFGASLDWLEDSWESYLDRRQTWQDTVSAANHGDEAARHRVTMEIAMGFAGSTSMKIAGGHAFEKHVLGVGANPADGLFRGMGIRTVAQMEAHIANVMAHPTSQKAFSRGRTGYWDAATSTVVIHNPRSPDLGTAFQPKDGIGYFNSLK